MFRAPYADYLHFMHGSSCISRQHDFLWGSATMRRCDGAYPLLFFYLLCGVRGVGACADSPASDIPLIGASGAVAGVIAAYLMLHPNVRVWCLWFFRIPLRVSAGFALLVWIGLQVLNIALSTDTSIAWWAHIGGLIAGAVLVLFMRRPGVPLFDRATGVEPKHQPGVTSSR